MRKRSPDPVAVVRRHALATTIAVAFFMKNVGAQALPTYYGQVQAIVNKNCVQCHRPYGWGTTNEMFNFIMEYVDYKTGDEALSLFREN